MKYKNYILDMGKVLVDYDAHRACSHFTNDEEMIEKAFNIIFCSIEWPFLDCGLYTQEFAWSQIEKRIKDEKLRELCYNVFNTWETYGLWAVEGMREVVEELKRRGVKLYILSNITSSILKVDKQLIPGYELFDGRFYSFQHGLMKPQKEIYESFLKTYNLNAEDCFFVDDLEINIKAAKEVGIDGYVHRNCDVNELKKVLEI